MLSQLLSYSANWTLTIRGLCLVSKEQEKAIQNAIKELESHNYLTRLKLQDEKDKIDKEHSTNKINNKIIIDNNLILRRLIDEDYLVI